MSGTVRVRFDSFLERILYHPQWGYYSGPNLQFGEGGDFYTSPHVHVFFAEILAEQVLQFWEARGTPARFVLLEMGPGDAALAAQVLASVERRFPRFYEALHYVGADISPILRERQAARLARFPRASLRPVRIAQARDAWDFETVPAVEADCIFSNEFLDALPFRRLRHAQRRWSELYVQVRPNGMEEVWQPLEAPPDDLAGLEEDRTLEWRDAMAAFYGFASTALKCGTMLHFDYGDRRETLRPEGTLRTFYRHSLGEEPLARPGEQDVTASVDFTHALDLGERFGFKGRILGQRQYLMERGILEKTALRFKDRNSDDAATIREKLALKDLIVPGGISDHFKVLIQERGN